MNVLKVYSFTWSADITFKYLQEIQIITSKLRKPIRVVGSKRKYFSCDLITGQPLVSYPLFVSNEYEM